MAGWLWLRVVTLGRSVGLVNAYAIAATLLLTSPTSTFMSKSGLSRRIYTASTVRGSGHPGPTRHLFHSRTMRGRVVHLRGLLGGTQLT